MTATANVYVYDALDENLSLFGPALTQRVHEFSRKYFTEGLPDGDARQKMARITLGDPGAIMLIVVESNSYKLVGHCYATLETHVHMAKQKSWVFGWQVQIDKTYPGVSESIIEILTEWGKQHHAEEIMMVTEHDKAFARKYGFEARRVIMTRSLGGEE